MTDLVWLTVGVVAVWIFVMVLGAWVHEIHTRVERLESAGGSPLESDDCICSSCNLPPEPPPDRTITR